jgi:hypothetical protein
MEVSGQLYDPVAFPPRERVLGSNWIGGWVGPRAVLDAVVKRKIPGPLGIYTKNWQWNLIFAPFD